MKKILVTGATGFIGNYVIERLLNSGCRVIASSANPARAATAPWFASVDYIPFDLGSIDPSTGHGPSADYYALFGRPDAMLHLAWEGLPNYKSAFHLEQNYPRHAAFLENLLTHGLRDLTVTGTCFEYGMQEGCLREDLPVFPANPYGQAKNALNDFLKDLQKTIPFTLKWIRLFYMYGKGQNPNSLLSQLDRALAAGETSFNMSGGEQVRDFMPVEDVADAIRRIVLQDRVQGTINCCSGRPVTVRQFVEEYLGRTDRKILLNTGYYPYPDYEPMRFWGDNTKLKTILNNE